MSEFFNDNNRFSEYCQVLIGIMLIPIFILVVWVADLLEAARTRRGL